MKRICAIICLAALLLSTGCALLLPPQQALHPPVWIHGEWSTGSLDGSWTFSATTMIMRVGITSLDYGEMYLHAGIHVTEIITDTFYSYTVPGEVSSTMEFSKVDANTINMTTKTDFSTIGPVPLYRQ